MTKPKKPRLFKLTPLKERKAPVMSPGMNEQSARASDRRVWEATPSFQKLDKFLGREPPK